MLCRTICQKTLARVPRRREQLEVFKNHLVFVLTCFVFKSNIYRPRQGLTSFLALVSVKDYDLQYPSKTCKQGPCSDSNFNFGRTEWNILYSLYLDFITCLLINVYCYALLLIRQSHHLTKSYSATRRLDCSLRSAVFFPELGSSVFCVFLKWICVIIENKTLELIPILTTFWLLMG